MADPRPLVDTLLTPGLGEDAVYDDDRGLTIGQFSQRLDLATRHLESLIGDAMATKRRMPIDVEQAANLDADGAAIFPVYQVGAGFMLELCYMSVEAATYHPASPYSNANFYLELRSCINPISVGTPTSIGNLIDFLPTTAGVQGMPDIGSYDPPRIIRSQQYVVCKVVSGPASKRIAVRLGGWLSADR